MKILIEENVAAIGAGGFREVFPATLVDGQNRSDIVLKLFHDLNHEQKGI